MPADFLLQEFMDHGGASSYMRIFSSWRGEEKAGRWMVYNKKNKLQSMPDEKWEKS